MKDKSKASMDADTVTVPLLFPLRDVEQAKEVRGLLTGAFHAQGAGGAVGSELTYYDGRCLPGEATLAVVRSWRGNETRPLEIVANNVPPDMSKVSSLAIEVGLGTSPVNLNEVVSLLAVLGLRRWVQVSMHRESWTFAFGGFRPVWAHLDEVGKIGYHLLLEATVHPLAAQAVRDVMFCIAGLLKVPSAGVEHRPYPVLVAEAETREREQQLRVPDAVNVGDILADSRTVPLDKATVGNPKPGW